MTLTTPARLLLFVVSSLLGAVGVAPAAEPFARVAYAPLARWEAAALPQLDLLGVPEAAPAALSGLTQWGRYDGWATDRPFGRVWFEVDDEEVEIDEVWLIPYSDLPSAMDVATFGGIVSYRQVEDDHIEIDRPEDPYHVILRDGYLCLTESPELLRAAPGGPRAWLALGDRELIVASIEPPKISAAQRDAWQASVFEALAPTLQGLDQEPPLVTLLRKQVTERLRGWLSALTDQTQSGSFALAFDPATSVSSLSFRWTPTAGSRAHALAQRRPSTLAALPAALPAGRFAACAWSWPWTGDHIFEPAKWLGSSILPADWPATWRIGPVLSGEAYAIEHEDARWTLHAHGDRPVPLTSTDSTEQSAPAETPAQAPPEWKYEREVGPQELPWSMRFAETDRFRLKVRPDRWSCDLGAASPAERKPTEPPDTTAVTDKRTSGWLVAQFRGRTLIPLLDGPLRRGAAQGFAVRDDLLTTSLRPAGGTWELRLQGEPGWALATLCVWNAFSQAPERGN